MKKFYTLKWFKKKEKQLRNAPRKYRMIVIDENSQIEQKLFKYLRGSKKRKGYISKNSPVAVHLKLYQWKK